MENLTIKKIVAPVDFSDPSVQALQYAVSVAKQLDAEIILIHVAEPPPFAPDLTEPHGYEDRVTEYAEKELGKLMKDYVKDGVQARFLTRFGRPYEEIVAAAKQEGADLIVMATHGRSGVRGMLIGSTTEKLVRTASIKKA